MEKMLDEIKKAAIVSNVPISIDVVHERVHTFLFNHYTPSRVTDAVMDSTPVMDTWSCIERSHAAMGFAT